MDAAVTDAALRAMAWPRIRFGITSLASIDRDRLSYKAELMSGCREGTAIIVRTGVFLFP